MLIPKFGGVGMYVGSEGVRARGGRSEVKKAKKNVWFDFDFPFPSLGLDFPQSYSAIQSHQIHALLEGYCGY